jgi:hypothetical protein
MHGVAVRVGDDLELDVARAGEIFFEQHALVAEGRERFAFRGGECFAELGGRLHDAHAAPAAAGRGFDQDGQSDPAASRSSRAGDWSSPS